MQTCFVDAQSYSEQPFPICPIRGQVYRFPFDDPHSIWQSLRSHHPIPFRRCSTVPLCRRWIDYISKSKAGLGRDQITVFCLCWIETSGAEWRRQIKEGDDLCRIWVVFDRPMPNQGCRQGSRQNIGFVAIQQNLWLQSPLLLAENAGAVQAEWGRRKISDPSSGALVAKQAFGRANRDFTAVDK